MQSDFMEVISLNLIRHKYFLVVLRLILNFSQGFLNTKRIR